MGWRTTRMRPSALSGLHRKEAGGGQGMVWYRRNRVPDGTFFFTATLRDRRGDALLRHVDALRESWRRARAMVPHEVVAVVVLPEHLHAVLRMRDGAGDYPALWREIKKGFTRRLGLPGGASPWQRRFWNTRSATTTTCGRTSNTCISIR